MMEAAGWVKPLAVFEELGHRLLKDVERIWGGISLADKLTVARLLKTNMESLDVKDPSGIQGPAIYH
jgi:hypothetical protein